MNLTLQQLNFPYLFFVLSLFFLCSLTDSFVLGCSIHRTLGVKALTKEGFKNSNGLVMLVLKIIHLATIFTTMYRRITYPFIFIFLDLP